MKLLEQVRQLLRTRHYSHRTEQCYLRWIEQYIRLLACLSARVHGDDFPLRTAHFPLTRRLGTR